MPRKPPNESTAYDTLPLCLSIMTRSIDPILLRSAPYTAVPSTLSLPIRLPVSFASRDMSPPPGEFVREKRDVRRNVPDGRATDGRRSGFRIDGLSPIVPA